MPKFSDNQYWMIVTHCLCAFHGIRLSDAVATVKHCQGMVNNDPGGRLVYERDPFHTACDLARPLDLDDHLDSYLEIVRSIRSNTPTPAQARNDWVIV